MLTELDNVTEFEVVAPRRNAGCSDSPRRASPRHQSAGNETACDETATAGNEPEYGLRPAPAIEGSRGAADAAWLSHYEIDRVARARRALVLGTMVVATIRAAVAFARRARARRRQLRRAAAIRGALRELDDRALHDLGFDRSEIASIAAEATGGTERTRVRALSALHGFST
jgi:uncharacterized protein YjiS (DUF1127 family)